MLSGHDGARPSLGVSSVEGGPAHASCTAQLLWTCCHGPSHGLAAPHHQPSGLGFLCVVSASVQTPVSVVLTAVGSSDPDPDLGWLALALLKLGQHLGPLRGGVLWDRGPGV